MGRSAVTVVVRSSGWPVAALAAVGIFAVTRPARAQLVAAEPVAPIEATAPEDAPPIEVQVVLQVVLDAQGNVLSAVETSRAPAAAPDSFGLAASLAVRRARFHPSTRDGRPIRSRIEYVVVFQPRAAPRSSPAQAHPPVSLVVTRVAGADEPETVRVHDPGWSSPRGVGDLRVTRETHRRISPPEDERDALRCSWLLRRSRGRRGARQRRLSARLRSRPRLGYRDAGRFRPHQHPDSHPGPGIRRRELHHPRGRAEHSRPRGALRPAARRCGDCRKRLLRPRRAGARLPGEDDVRVVRPGARPRGRRPEGSRRRDLRSLLGAEFRRLRPEPGVAVGGAHGSVRRGPRHAGSPAPPGDGVRRPHVVRGGRAPGRCQRRPRRLLRLLPELRAGTGGASGARDLQRRARPRRVKRRTVSGCSVGHVDELPQPTELHRRAGELDDQPRGGRHPARRPLRDHQRRDGDRRDRLLPDRHRTRRRRARAHRRARRHGSRGPHWPDQVPPRPDPLPRSAGRHGRRAVRISASVGSPRGRRPRHARRRRVPRPRRALLEALADLGRAPGGSSRRVRPEPAGQPRTGGLRRAEHADGKPRRRGGGRRGPAGDRRAARSRRRSRPWCPTARASARWTHRV